MFDRKSLSDIGIKVTKKLDDRDVIEIVNKVSNKLVLAFPDSGLSFLNIYKTLLDTPMYYAKIDKGLSEANYDYKNSSIYFSEDADLSEINEFVFHEFIHRLQEHKDKKGKITRLGVCEIKELSVQGAALNEGAIQYITAKAFDMPKKNISVYDLDLPSKTEYYPIITNIVAQLAFLLDENALIDSTINGNEEFKISIIDNIGESEYHLIDKNLNEILKNKNRIMELKKNDNENLNTVQIQKNMDYIKELYFETQKTIYTSYFNGMIKRCENEEEVSNLRKKLYNYRSLVGTNSKYIDFNVFCIEFEKRAKEKIEIIKSRTALMVINNNKIFKIFRKLKRLFTNLTSEYYK